MGNAFGMQEISRGRGGGKGFEMQISVDLEKDFLWGGDRASKPCGVSLSPL